MVAWWRSDQQITIATGVSSWGDLSGNGHTATQGTAGAQPTFNASDAAYGNKPSLTFNGAVPQNLQTTAFTVTQPFTVYQAVANTDGNAGSFDCVFGGTGGRLRRFINQWDLSSGTDLLSGVNTSAVVALAGSFNGNSSNIWVNASASPVNGAGGANNLTNGAALGGNGASISGLTGTMAETIVYTGAHTNANVATIFAYFAARYGIAAS